MCNLSYYVSSVFWLRKCTGWNVPKIITMGDLYVQYINIIVYSTKKMLRWRPLSVWPKYMYMFWCCVHLEYPLVSFKGNMIVSWLRVSVCRRYINKCQRETLHINQQTNQSTKIVLQSRSRKLWCSSHLHAL